MKQLAFNGMNLIMKLNESQGKAKVYNWLPALKGPFSLKLRFFG